MTYAIAINYGLCLRTSSYFFDIEVEVWHLITFFVFISVKHRLMTTNLQLIDAFLEMLQVFLLHLTS